MSARTLGTAGRRLRGLLLTGLLATGALAVSPGPAAAAEIPGCSLTALKPGGSGTTARGRFSLSCVWTVPFQYQVALWEKDDGPDQNLSQTPWTDATFPPASSSYAGKGPAVGCQTEAGKEELYTKARVRIGAPGSYTTTAWKTSPVLTTRTCQ